MALQWDFRGIEDNENVCWDHNDSGERSQMKSTTEAILYYAMVCDVNWGVSDRDVDEFIVRIRFYDKLFTPLWASQTESGLSDEVIRAHVGLKINVSPTKRGPWMKRISDNFMQERERELAKKARQQ